MYSTEPLANRRAQYLVSRVEAFARDHPASDVVGAQQLACGGSEHAKAEPRELIPGEVAIAPVEAFRSDRLGVELGGENAERAVYTRQIGPVLIKLALQFIDDASEFAALPICARILGLKTPIVVGSRAGKVLELPQ